MEEQLRIQKLKEISSGTPAMSGLKIRYKGEMQTFNAYKIPLNYLVYNIHNGRIGSEVKSYEKQYHPLNPELEHDRKIIEHFLWISKENRNLSTEESLVENGQKVWGIITSDGVIIDGNRRAFLLNKIYQERSTWSSREHNVDHCQYFIAIILPEGADKKEILKLETTYQMGEDEKLDYNPIEKYLKCKDLIEEGFLSTDIAKMMNEKESSVKDWLDTMKLMDEYLSYLGYEGIYTRLDKTEDLFLNLNGALRRYENETSLVSWPYSDMDINELKLVCFDYIRSRYEGKEYRLILKPSKKDSIFCKSKELWDSFLQEHKKTLSSIKEEPIETAIKEAKSTDLTKVLSARDEDWSNQSMNLLKANLNKHVSKLDDLNEANQPLELLQRAWSTLNSINTDVPQFFEEDKVLEIVKDINKLTHEFMKSIQKAPKKYN